MTTFRVWDPVSESGDHAPVRDVFDAEDAAADYAENDVDGHSDGVYTKNGREIDNLERDGRELVVENLETGERVVCRVGVVEFEPVYRACVVRR